MKQTKQYELINHIPSAQKIKIKGVGWRDIHFANRYMSEPHVFINNKIVLISKIKNIKNLR